MRFQNTNEAPCGRLQEIAMTLCCGGGFGRYSLKVEPFAGVKLYGLYGGGAGN
jgi:hypothetical protein